MKELPLTVSSTNQAPLHEHSSIFIAEPVNSPQSWKTPILKIPKEHPLVADLLTGIRRKARELPHPSYGSGIKGATKLLEQFKQRLDDRMNEISECN
jgi:hypothetical protein